MLSGLLPRLGESASFSSPMFRWLCLWYCHEYQQLVPSSLLIPDVLAVSSSLLLCYFLAHFYSLPLNHATCCLLCLYMPLIVVLVVVFKPSTHATFWLIRTAFLWIMPLVASCILACHLSRCIKEMLGSCHMFCKLLLITHFYWPRSFWPCNSLRSGAIVNRRLMEISTNFSQC